jgi:hypothetical protein
MPREVTDGNGVRWTCAQAYAGLGGADEKADAARVEGTDDRYRVVCTPSGGSQTVELELPGGWEDSMSDDDLLAAIGKAG